MKKLLAFLSASVFPFLTFGQNPHYHSYKELGLMVMGGTIKIPATNENGGLTLKLPTNDDLLASMPNASANVQAFTNKFPNFESIEISDILLDEFYENKKITEGIHLFFGLKNDKLEIVLVNTDIIDTTKVNDKNHFKANFNTAYFWNNVSRKWELVEDEFTMQLANKKPIKIYKGKLKKEILAIRDAFPLHRKGYFISKDLLVDFSKKTNQPLKIFLGLSGSEIHLYMPLLPKISNSQIVLKEESSEGRPKQYFYETKFYNLNTAPLIAGMGHLTIRPCPDYCGNGQ